MEILILLIIYFIPTLTAISRKHNNIWPIVVVNLFLWWTFIWWIVALAMSFSNNHK